MIIKEIGLFSHRSFLKGYKVDQSCTTKYLTYRAVVLRINT